MGKAWIKLTPSLASVLRPRATNWLVLDRDITEGDSLKDVLAGLADSDGAFRKAILNAETGNLSEGVLAVLNDCVLPTDDLATVKLHDGDTVILLPVYTGG
ncbi:MAG: MoaD/ThiS family protein [Chloroflexi bacterium]|nr:MoaD/ThiS family protein [Chloroflexota bacterium]